MDFLPFYFAKGICCQGAVEYSSTDTSIHRGEGNRKRWGWGGGVQCCLDSLDFEANFCCANSVCASNDFEIISPD